MWILLQGTWKCFHLDSLILIVLNTYLEMGLQDNMVVLFLIFEENLYCFSWWLHNVHPHRQCIQILNSPHRHQHLSFIILITAILIEVRWFNIVLLIFLSLNISGIKHLAYICWPFISLYLFVFFGKMYTWVFSPFIN